MVLASWFRQRVAVIAAVTFGFGASLAAHADEKGGLFVSIQKKVASREDLTTPTGGSDYRPVDRTLTLKMDIKNTSMKPMEATTADYIVLIQRWGTPTSTGLQSYSGSKPLDALATSSSTTVDLGEFKIGGWQYFTSASEQYIDRMVGWKVTITRDNQKLEFKSGTSFDTLVKKAKPGR